MNGLGLALLEGGKLDEAASVFASLVDVAQRVLPSSSRAPFIYMLHQGMCARRSGRTTQAEELLLRAYAGLGERLGPAHEYTLETIGELVKLYDATGDAARSAEYRALLVESESQRSVAR